MVNHFLFFVRFQEIAIPSVYTVLLLVFMLWFEFASHHRHRKLSFTQLLDGLELVPTQDPLLVTAAKNDEETCLDNTLETKEALRRMAGNARILVDLARLHESEVVLEYKITQKIYKESIRITLCVNILQLVSLTTWHATGAASLLMYTGKSYWSIVDRLRTSYRLHNSQRSYAALTTACNLNS